MWGKNKTITYALLTIMLIAVLAAGVIMVAGALMRYDEEISDLSLENTELEKEGSRLEASLSKLRSEKAALEADIKKLKDEIAVLEANLADSGKYFADEITALKEAVELKESAIGELEADIARYQTVFTIDVRAQAHLIDELVSYIESSAPYRLVPISREELDSFEADAALDGSDASKASLKKDALDQNDIYLYTPEGAKEEIPCRWVSVTELMEKELEAMEGEPLFTAEELALSGLSEKELTLKILRERIASKEDIFYPSISIYYEDLLTGYHFEYEADKIYDAASVIKAPYILSVLKVISADESAFFEKLSNSDSIVPSVLDTDGDGTVDAVEIEYSNSDYDLTDVVVYDSKTMYKDGSGKIKDMADGSEFTYLDFIKYTLEHSDNVAYSMLRERFGFDTMRELARELGAKSVLRGGNSMSAADCGKLFKAIYEFTEADEKYGGLMRESMLKGNHTVIIPHASYPSKVMHKYGWDKTAYHDAGIVLYDDKPYVLTVFSNMDNGGAEVNAYLQNIVKMINKLHGGFYGN